MCSTPNAVNTAARRRNELFYRPNNKANWEQIAPAELNLFRAKMNQYLHEAAKIYSSLKGSFLNPPSIKFRTLTVKWDSKMISVQSGSSDGEKYSIWIIW